MRLSDANGGLTLVPVRRRPGGWALIQLDVVHPRGTWQTLDECLERNELREIARWLRAIARGKRPKELEFMEPNLRFACLSNGGDLATIRVWFEGEVRPSWAPWEAWGLEDLWLDVTLPLEQCEAAAQDLRKEVERIERD